MKTKHRLVKTVLFAVTGIILFVVLVNQITVYPFVWSFRMLMSMAGQQGNIGFYQEITDCVRKTATVNVAVAGYPDASFTVYRPEDNQELLPVIVYIHGGGWSLGSADSVAWFAKLLAANGYVVCNVDYALAPEYPFPASTHQLAEVINYIYEHADDYGINCEKFFIGGNSAGAHLSSQLGALFTDEEYAQQLGIETIAPSKAICGLLLFNGVYNFDNAGECGFFAFDKWVWAYTGQKNYRSYDRLDEISTVKHITPNYPATFITVGDADPLEPQTREFTDRLCENGVEHIALLWTDTDAKLNHDYIYEMNTEQAQKAFGMILQFLTEH